MIRRSRPCRPTQAKKLCKGLDHTRHQGLQQTLLEAKLREDSTEAVHPIRSSQRDAACLDVVELGEDAIAELIGEEINGIDSMPGAVSAHLVEHGMQGRSRSVDKSGLYLRLQALRGSDGRHGAAD
eukprot:CAMPEP_0170577530 /NCGR_PEP_ID=MMETSP0224-20130122/4976_1 /TAXON_ID=285029 /ORGANISM="Togula jolla, Strain CCCM 725" /LENGTH=125 /DNA_ID=CAMNT_0010900447 /DNA_START=324 /DNA_END=702 /DNA_ORIENTATION=+